MPEPKKEPKFKQLVEGVDFYKEGDKVVFTSVYHLKRGYCCHSKCRHCPYGLGVAQAVRIDILGFGAKGAEGDPEPRMFDQKLPGRSPLVTLIDPPVSKEESPDKP